MGLATVYRKLTLRGAEGAMSVIALPMERSRYDMAESAHHQCCRDCARRETRVQR
jgi:Fe2+ or Zn2+ uptake regulation protein